MNDSTESTEIGMKKVRVKVRGIEAKEDLKSLEEYSSLLKDLDPELITPEDETVLKRAFRRAKEELGPEELVNWFTWYAEPFYRSASWRLLSPMYEQVLDIAEEKLGPEHPATAAALNGLAGIYRYLGKYEEALPLYTRALAIRETKTGPDSLETGNTLCDLAVLYFFMDKKAEALPLYERALEIHEKVFSLEHAENPEYPGNLETVRTLNRMAFFYRGTEEPEKAEELYRRALEHLEILREAAPENVKFQAYTAGTLNNLGVLLSEEMGRMDEAEEIYGRALKLQETSLSPDHPQVAQTLNNLGLLYYNTGSPEKALALYTRALEIFEKLGKMEHMGYANTLNNLAGVYVRKRRCKEALELYEKTLAIREKLLGEEHPEVAKTLNNLAELYRQMGEHKKALPLYTRALKITEKSLGSEHMDVGTTLNNLAGLHESMDEYETASEMYERALGIIEKELGIDHPYFKITRNNLLALYEKMERNDR